MKIILLFLCFAIVNGQRNFQPFSLVRIGGLFYDYEYEVEEAFLRTIAIINNRSDTNFKLVPELKSLTSNDGPAVIEKYACEMLKKGVYAIFGPSSKADSDIVSVISNYTGVPNILFDAINEESEQQKAGHKLTLNVYPAQPILSKAYSDMVENFGWKKFTIVYDADDDNAPIRLQDILQLKRIHNDLVRVRKFRKGDNYEVLWKSVEGERRVVLDCPPDLLIEVLNASVPYDLTTPYNHLFLTNLETPPGILLPLDNSSTFLVNITAARLKSKNVTTVGFNPTIGMNTDVPTKKLLLDIIHDAVMLYYMALKNISSQYQIPAAPVYDCDYLDFNPQSVNRWPFGFTIYDTMKKIAPLSDTNFHYSYIQFDDAGYRTNFSVELYEPMNDTEVGVWNTKGHISTEHIEIKKRKKPIYRIATRLGAPYLMEKKEAIELNITTNERYEGYVVDLMALLADKMNFDYVFVVKDDGYGEYNPLKKRWNGIIGELLNNDAHMGICDLTITQDRKEVVDFSVPIMTLGVSILTYQNTPPRKEWSAHFSPIEFAAWIYVMIVMLGAAVVYLILSRITLGDWENPHPCNLDPEVVENKWNLANSLYLIIGPIMGQGCDILPTHATIRLFTAFYWIFAIILLNSYTAGLSSRLTTDKLDTSIDSIAKLAGQSSIKFGTIHGGSTYKLFAESDETTYRLAFNRMQGADPTVYANSNEEGVYRVLKHKGEYMFLMESTTLEYNTNRDCKLKSVGKKFGEKHYAIAVPIDASYRHSLNVAILTLHESGVLSSLKKKWWERNMTICTKEEVVKDQLTFDNVRGIFYTLIGGVGIAYIIGIAEFMIHCQQLAAEEGLLFKQTLIRELKFALDIRNTKKPILLASRTSSSSVGTDNTSLSNKSFTSHKTFKSHKSFKSNKSIESTKSSISNKLSKSEKSQLTSTADGQGSKGSKSLKNFITKLTRRHKN